MSRACAWLCERERTWPCVFFRTSRSMEVFRIMSGASRPESSEGGVTVEGPASSTLAREILDSRRRRGAAPSRFGESPGPWVKLL